MENKKEEKVQAILNSASGIGPAELPPFFYAKVRARMEREAGMEKIFFLARPVFLVVSLCVVLTINVIFLALQQRPGNHSGHPGSVQGIESFAAAYGLENKTVYE